MSKQSNIVLYKHFTKDPFYFATGEVNRQCISSGKWGAPNFDNCVDKIFEDILDKVCFAYHLYCRYGNVIIPHILVDLLSYQSNSWAHLFNLPAWLV